MLNIKSLSESFEETLKDGELQKITAEIIEAAGDTFIESDFIKNIPVLGIFTGLAKGFLNIRDKLFLKKLLTFLKELQSIPAHQRRKQVEKIENSSDYGIKVGEKLMYIIDRNEDHLKAHVVGKIFGYYLREVISYRDFLKCTGAIDLLLVDDLNGFIRLIGNKFSLDDYSIYLTAGLMKLTFEKPKFVDNSRLYGKKIGTNKELNSGALFLNITPVGELLRGLLK